MLKEEQAAALLERCETVAGKPLSGIRGSMRKAEKRAAAVWELIVIDAVSQIGAVEYEPLQGGSPDIRLHPAQARPLWLEVAFLYPKFWREERKSEALIQWVFQEAEHRSISPWKIQCRLDGDERNEAGPVRTLPDLHEVKTRLQQDAGISRFFDHILSVPNKAHSFSSTQYSITLSYIPNATGPYLFSGGLVQEAPKTIEEHAVYRVLNDKARQHSVDGPRIICIGSDQSPVLSPFIGDIWKSTLRDAVSTAFHKHRSLSAVITVRIEDSTNLHGQYQKRAVADYFVNPQARERLTEYEFQLLQRINFNRWKYTYPLNRVDERQKKGFRRITGGLTSYDKRGGGMNIEIPAPILVDILAGKTSLAEAYSLSENDPVAVVLRERWIVESCSLKGGSIELGEAPKVVLSMTPPPLPVY